MTLTEARPTVNALSHDDKVQLLQELMSELSPADMVPYGEYPIWSPYDSFEAAQTLNDLLERSKEEPV
jgi:hypothetical protein